MACDRQSSKKYATRAGPPYKAQKCRHRIKKGNNSKMYKSKKSNDGVFRWIRVDSKKSSNKLKVVSKVRSKSSKSKKGKKHSKSNSRSK